ncbi:MAG: T9SS type A sorting domain-containing protein, partial [Snowella sp.]
MVLTLFNEANNEISTANINKLLSPNNYESISLNGLPAGNYRILVYDFWGGLFNPDDPSGLPIVKYLPYTLNINAPTTGADNFESNNTRLTARNLGLISGLRQENDLSIDTDTDRDWYKFEISQQGTDKHYLSIDFTNSLGDLDIILYNEQGQLISSSKGVTDSETIPLSGLTQGIYYLEVYGYKGSINDYNLTINAPGFNVTPDRFEGANGNGNNTRQKAISLKSADNNNWIREIGFNTWENLSIGLNDEDWFKFELKAAGQSENYVAISFDTYQGDIDLELYDSAGTLRKSAKGFRNTELISLDKDSNGNPFAVGTYYVKVLGYSGARNPNYTLSINTPGSDRFEDNDDKDSATILKRNSYQQTWDNLSIDDEDWFEINLPGNLTVNDYISINFDHSKGDIDLEIYDFFNSNGTKIIGKIKSST